MLQVMWLVFTNQDAFLGLKFVYGIDLNFFA